MLSRKPFKIRLSDKGKIKDVILVYYKHIKELPIFSCNELGHCRLINIPGKGNIIMIGSDILGKLTDNDILIIAWSLIIKQYIGFSRTEQAVNNMIDVDLILSNIFGTDAISNTLKHIINNIVLDEKYRSLITYRIYYLENKKFKTLEYNNISTDDILDKIGLVQIAEVA